MMFDLPSGARLEPGTHRFWNLHPPRGGQVELPIEIIVDSEGEAVGYAFLMTLQHERALASHGYSAAQFKRDIRHLAGRTGVNVAVER